MKEEKDKLEEFSKELQRLQTKIQKSDLALKEANQMLKRLKTMEQVRLKENNSNPVESSNVKSAEYKKAALAQLEFLRSFAKAKGMSDQAIADKSGIGRPNISRMLSGKNIPRLDTFMILCEAVGLPAIDIAKTVKRNTKV